MKNIIEIKNSIEILINHPHTFGWAEFGDLGNPCAGRLDRMDATENREYAETYCSVLQAMPKYSDLHKRFAPVLARELDLRTYPRYDYMVKLLARIFQDDDQVPDSSAVEQMAIFTSKVQKYMKDYGVKTLTPSDMQIILNH